MKFIVLIYPDGVVAKFSEGEETYESLIKQIKESNPLFEPYDELEEQESLWMDVISKSHRARMMAPKS